jgi:biotin transport system substrate-specific component
MNLTWLTFTENRVNEVYWMEFFSGRFENAKFNFFKKRYEMDFVYKVGAALFFAAFTGLMAQVRIYLPFTPVPITGQVFPALLAGFVLGKWYGGLSQLLFALLGGLGIPWGAPSAGAGAFTMGGFAWLVGPTGGYIAGFIAAAFVIGYLTDSYVGARKLIPQLAIMLSGVVLIYFLGSTWFFLGSTWFYIYAKGSPALQNWVLTTLGASSFGLRETFYAAVLPFIPGDLIKAVGAALLGTSLLPKRPFAREKDANVSA